jgi:hypothetical protein
MTQTGRFTLILATTLSIATFAAAQSPTEPPPSQQAVFTVTGKGVQIYACQQAAGATQWVFHAPEATLFNGAGDPVGTHAAGPIWRSNDGSAVKGSLVQQSAAPEPGAVPWLLLKAVSAAGPGIMAKVEFIRRSDTHGGVSPTTGCDARHLNAIARVPYTAAYTFYSAKPEAKP